MERIDGKMLWPIWFRAAEQRQAEYLTQFCQLLVNLHTLDWQPYVDAASADAIGAAQVTQGTPYLYVDRFSEMGHQFVADAFGSSFAPYLAWLEERRGTVPCRQPAPIRWDFHRANVLLCDNGAAMVIDWTQIEISDARFDLAWTLLLLGTQEGPEWRDRILCEYERIIGDEVEEFEYFEVIACVKRLATVATVLAGDTEQSGMHRIDLLSQLSLSVFSTSPV
jgi:aminoglycoside phosphotransferase (APT) family kinase protein